MTIAEKIVAIHEALTRHGIPHAFGGALALAFYTLDPRGTSDIDLNLFVSEDSPDDALDALPDGIADRPATKAVIVKEGQTRLWWDGTPVDVFFDNVSLHAQARENSRTVSFSETEIPILGPVELAAFKALFNRTRDWADLEAMVEAQTLSVEDAALAVCEIAGADDPRVARLKALRA